MSGKEAKNARESEQGSSTRRKRRRRRRGKKKSQQGNGPEQQGSTGQKEHEKKEKQEEEVRSTQKKVTPLNKARRLVFDEEGNMSAAAETSIGAIRIGEWSAPASHKKNAFMKQQKEQKAALATLDKEKSNRANESRSARQPSNNTREQDNDKDKDKDKDRGKGNGCNSHYISENYEQYKFLQTRPAVGDEILFKIVELQGWVPNLSDYKQAIVKGWSSDKQFVKLQIIFAPEVSKIVPKFRHPSTGEWVEATDAMEEEQEQGKTSPSCCLDSELSARN